MAFRRRSKRIPARTPGELDAMQAAGEIVGKALQEVRAAAASGVSTLELDAVAEQTIRDAGAYPTFNYHVAGFGGELVTVPYSGDHEDPEALIAKARQTKSKARLARYEEMAAEAEKTRKLDFEEIQIPPGPRLGSKVIEVSGLKKGFGERVLIDDLSFTLPRNGIVGIIGPNGAGKTSLLRIAAAMEHPSSGEAVILGSPAAQR